MRFFDVLNQIFNAIGWVKGWFTRKELSDEKKKRADAEAGLRAEKQENVNKERVRDVLDSEDKSDQEWIEERKKQERS